MTEKLPQNEMETEEDGHSHIFIKDGFCFDNKRVDALHIDRSGIHFYSRKRNHAEISFDSIVRRSNK